MKILYIAPDCDDYLSNSVFHGLRSVLGEDLIDSTKQSKLYKSCTLDLTNKVHGRGFTLYKLLDDIEVDRSDIRRKITSQYFDYIIYGVINTGQQTSFEYIKEVFDVYPDEKIVFLDGADTIDMINDLYNHGWYFKRELIGPVNRFIEPISFSIPKKKIRPLNGKLDFFAPLIPGVGSTFIYNSEESYYEMYSRSLFGLTWKKAGWDCLRHYEILAAGCAPFFVDIYHCPTSVLTTYPKDLAKKVFELKGLTLNYSPTQQFEYGGEHNMTITNVDYSKIQFDASEEYLCEYSMLVTEMQEYMREHLTTEATARYILNTIGAK